MLLIISFIFSVVWSIVATNMVKNKPKTCWAMIALMSVLVYYLY